MRAPRPGAAGAEGPSLARRILKVADGGLEQRTRAVQGHGQPLPSEEREFMESRFGYSFDAVRVHTGPAVDETATRWERAPSRWATR